jgi:RHS repeat-associated protein
MHYNLKDHQGNLTATIQGNTVERLSYDAWGRRRNPVGFGYSNVTHTFDRGYTLHEHYDDFDLINMNGRLYDPVLGRMLSPDIAIQDEYNAQAYNRYSYCFNNPLRFTDPSGYVVENPPYYFMLLNPDKILLKYYYGVDPSTVEYNTNESEGTQRINVKWKYEGDDYEANWVHQNLEGYYQTNKYGCLAIDMVAQERRFLYGNMDITEESMLGLFPEDNGIRAYDGWISFEELSHVYHDWGDKKTTALADPFESKFKVKYGDIEQYTFEAMNKGEGITYHYFTDDPDMNHAINAYQAVKYFDGNKSKTTYDIRMWDPDPNTGGRKPFTRYRLNKIHTLKLKLH